MPDNPPFPEHPAKLLLKATLPLWFGVLLVLVVTVITYSVWRQVRSRAMQSDEFRFSSASVHVTTTPLWVPASIVNDVVSEFQIGRTSRETLMDRDLLGELANAFSAYPWVESVTQVRASYPATVELKLVYRKPVCLVVLPTMTGGYAVDRHGVHLPNFLSGSQGTDGIDVNRYIKVLGIDTMPAGNIGEKWGGGIVENAAALAGHLGAENSILRIVSIRAVTTGANSRNTKTEYHLATAFGTEILWGEMPLRDNDPRKDHLLKLVRQYGSLDRSPDAVIDVR